MSLDHDPSEPPDLNDYSNEPNPQAESSNWAKSGQLLSDGNPFPVEKPAKQQAEIMLTLPVGASYALGTVELAAPIIPAPEPKRRALNSTVEDNYSQFGKLAEASIIKAMMLNRDHALIAAQSLKKQYFFDQTRGKLFHALASIAAERIEFIADLVTLYEKLNQLGYADLTTPAGKGLISEYVDYTLEMRTLSHAPQNFLSWCEVVIRAYVRRRVCQIGERSQLEAMSADKDIEQLFDEIEEAIKELKSLGARFLSRNAETIVEEMMQKSNEPPDVVPTGIYCLDRLLKDGGVKRTDYTIIAARPYQGKTTLATQIAANMGNRGKRVLWIPLEMSDEEEIGKFIQYYAQRSYAWEQGQYPSHEEMDDARQRLRAAQMCVAGFDLHVTNKGVMTIPMIWREAAMLHSEKPLDAIFVDQLTLISAHKRHQDERAQLEYFSRNLKLLTQELKIPVFLMHQISREGEKESENGGRITMRHLRSAGGVEQDADNVILIQPADTDNDTESIGEMTLAKQRKGRPGKWDYVYKKDVGVFDEDPNSWRIGIPKSPKRASGKKAQGEDAGDSHGFED